MSHDCVFGSSQERFDFEVLLDPLEEKFDVPTRFIKLSDGESSQFEVVGEEVIGVLGLGVIEPDQTQGFVVLLLG